MNYSIIGTGFIMPRHAEAIYYTKGKIIDIINTAHGQNNWQTIIKNPKTDCIVILTPNDLHFEMALMAAKNKKIVLCEKPLTINLKQIEKLAKYPNIFTVLQLRHHPKIKQLKKEINKNTQYKIEMDISAHRDKWYYKIWKGQKQRSGGVLFNLGIHYFDILIYLFGTPIESKTLTLNDKTGTGIIKGKNYICNWKISTDTPKNKQKRIFKINGINYNFSSKDNLSYENLHRNVYQDLLKGKGITPKQALKSTKLIEKLYESLAS
ncbi:Gfo/Idh/MocA family oxidoreductase [Patescibacteria group bacterium]|nr:Gfo/Idh/MocA family oxidoreductase [Patescibacteria group bacterium]